MAPRIRRENSNREKAQEKRGPKSLYRVSHGTVARSLDWGLEDLGL